MPINGAELDRWITGNYGEDQYRYSSETGTTNECVCFCHDTKSVDYAEYYLVNVFDDTLRYGVDFECPEGCKTSRVLDRYDDPAEFRCVDGTTYENGPDYDDGFPCRCKGDVCYC